MSDLLSIGASGVRGYQRALGTVGENIANAATEGYSRRTTALAQVGGGSGVVAAGIVRAGDAQKAADVRSASTDLARSESGIAWLQQIQSALTGNQIGDRLSGFFTSAQSLAADPTSAAARATMLEAASSAASAFSASGKALDEVAASLDASGAQAVSDLSAVAAALVKVNGGLGRVAAGLPAAADLADQRDTLLERMSAIADVSVSLDASGRATVRLGGASGPVLADQNGAGVVSYARNDDGAVAITLRSGGEAFSIAPSGGALAGIAEGAQRAAAARQGLNAVAGAFAAGVNRVQADGVDLDGKAGAALFASGATPTDLVVVLTDPRGIAAAAAGGGSRDNGNLAALQALRASLDSEGKVADLIAGNAATLAARQTVADAQSTIRDGAVAARDSVSGVTLDDEAVDLMRFQQAYQASSKVVQVSREILQTILDIR